MARASQTTNRLFCIEESVWAEDDGLIDQRSVLPTLEFLHRSGVLQEFVHRHALGPTEFENYFTWRQGRRIRSYGTVYLAFHGASSGLSVGDTAYSLEQLAELIGELPGGVVHLGSCSVLRQDEEGARKLLRTTGARMISGYKHNVEWLDSAALDTAWLGYIASYARLGDAERYFRMRYASLIEHLKWEAITSPAR